MNDSVTCLGWGRDAGGETRGTREFRFRIFGGESSAKVTAALEGVRLTKVNN